MVEFAFSRGRRLYARHAKASMRLQCNFTGGSTGRVLAEPLLVRAPSPPFDGSAMDGYAVRAADFSRGGPWTLPVVGESRTFAGGIEWLRENGVKVIDLDNLECREMLETFIAKHPEVWNEDIGEE